MRMYKLISRKHAFTRMLMVFFFLQPVLSPAQTKTEIVPQLDPIAYVSEIVISGNGLSMLSRAYNTAILWNISNGKIIKTKMNVAKIETSNDNRYVKICEKDGTCITWDLYTGQEINTKVEFAAKKLPYVDIVDNNYYSQTVSLQILDAETNKVVHYISNVPRSIKISAVANDLSTYIKVNKDSLFLCDFKTDKVLFSLGEKKEIGLVKYTPDGKGFVYSLKWYDNKIVLIDIVKKQECVTFKIDGDVNAIEWTPDGNTMISGGNYLTQFNYSNGKKIRSFKGYSSSIVASKISPNGKYGLVGTPKKVALFEIEGGNLLKVFNHTEGISSLDFSPDGKSIFVCEYGKIIHWDIESSEVLSSASLGNNTFYLDVSADGKTAITAEDHRLCLWDISQPNVIKAINLFNAHSKKVKLSNDGITIGTSVNLYDKGSFNYSIVVFDIPSGGQESIYFKNLVNDFSFSSDGSTLLTASNRYSNLTTSLIKLWNVKTKKEIGEFGDYTLNPLVLEFSHDAESFIAGYNDGSLKLWDIKNRAVIKTFQDNSLAIKSASFTPDGRYILTSSLDNTLKLWDVASGKSIYTMVIGSENDYQWLVYNNDGYWDGSPDCGDLVAIIKGIDAWGIDQFAVKNNRPDKILENFPNASPDLIAHYKLQYLKRLKKLGFVDKNGKPDESLVVSDIHTPLAKIIDSKPNEKFVDLKLNFSDSKYNLRTYNIFINDVPIYGSYGRTIKGKTFEASEKIELTAGVNKIEVSCTNDKGVESFRAITTETYTPQLTEKSDLYFIGFGVSKYKDPSLNLNYADKDARDLGELFNRMKSHFGNVYTSIHTNEECTIENIRKSKDILKNAKPNDILILFIAGHGLHDTDNDETYYFLTHNTDLKNLKGTAATFETIEEILQGVPPRNKLFLMDACESGEMDDEIYENLSGFGNLTDLGIASRGFKTITSDKQQATSKKTQSISGKRTYLYQKDRYIYNDLSRRSGAIVFSSSKGGELSYESSAFENGFFTYQIINALQGAACYRKGLVPIDGLKEYVTKTVAAFSQGKQNPTVDRDNIYQKFNLPLTPAKSNSKDITQGNMVFVKGGRFMNKKSKLFNTAARLKDFYMSKYEVTQGQWKENMKTNPSKYVGDSLPVDNVNWYECIEYCNLRSIKEGLQPYYTIDKTNIDKSIDKKNDKYRWRVTPNENANGYRLPTELEYRYAVSGGQLSNWYTFSGSDTFDEISSPAPTKVGSKLPNELGIYDLMGNIYEWCWDWNPEWVTVCNTKGASVKDKQRLLLGYRYIDDPVTDYCRLDKGLRVVRNAP
ncbi:MAG: SUMF1/EgtB/PvdO family nonheme iron enzyme [Tenuifilaceae bacterium]